MSRTEDFVRSLLPARQSTLPSPSKIFSEAVILLGQDFSASRVVIFTIQKGRAGAKATYEYCANGMSSILGQSFPWEEDYTEELLNSSLPLPVNDIATDKRFNNKKISSDWKITSLMSMPIQLGDTIVGLITIQTEDSRKWEISEISHFAHLISGLSYILELIRPYAELRKQFDRYLLVNELARQFTLINNVSDLFHTLVVELRRILAFDFVSLNIIDETTGRLLNTEQARYSTGRFQFGHFLPASYSIPGWCVANWRYLIIRNLAKETVLRVRREWLDAGLIGCAAFPLTFADQVIGAILFFTHSKSGFDDTEVQILQQSVEQTSAAIHRVRTVEQLVKNVGIDVQAVRREELIKRISKAIGSQLDWELVLQHAVNELGRHLAVSRCYIILSPQEDETSNIVFEYRAKDISPLTRSVFPIKNNFGLQETISSGEVVMYVDAQSEELLRSIEEYLKDNNVRSTLYYLIATTGDKRAFIGLDQCDRTRTWTKDEQNLVITVSQELAIALEQAELIAKLQRQAEREALLNRLTASIRASLDPKQVLQTTVEELAKTLAIDHCFIGLADSNKKQIVIESEFCATGIKSLQGRAVDRRIFGDNLDWSNSGKFLSVTSSVRFSKEEREKQEQENEAETTESTGDTGLPAAAYVPVYVDKSLIAIIGLKQQGKQRFWKKEEVSLLNAVADQVAVAISQANLLEQSRAQAEKEVLLNQMFKTLADSFNRSEIIEKLVVQLGQSLLVDRCFILLYFEPIYDTSRLHSLEHKSEYLATDISSVKENLEFFHPKLLKWLAKNQRLLVVNDVADYPFAEGKTELINTGVKSLLIVPIVQSGKLIGIMGLHQCEKVRIWQETEIDLVAAIASQTAVAINNAYLFRHIADSQEHWQRTFDSMTDGVALLDQEGKVICVNQALNRLCNPNNEDLVGKHGSKLFSVAPEAYIGFEPIAESLKSSVSMQVEVQDLRSRILRQNIDPILDEKRKVANLILVVRDVTKEREAEKEMAQRNRELSTLNAISEEISKSLEIDKIIISAFAKTVEVMGADTGLVLLLDEMQESLRPVAYHGQQPESILSLITQPNSQRSLIKSAADFKQTYVIENIDKDEMPDPIFRDIAHRLGLRAVLITTLQSKNRGLGLLLVAHRQKHKFQTNEIQLINAIGRQVGVAMENARLVASLQEALQELREANRLKDEFLATLSHELRTPLTSIRGWTELLIEHEGLEEDVYNSLKAVLNNADSLQQLINDLLELSRIENRVLKLEIEPTDINLVVISAVQTVKQMADNRAVIIEQNLTMNLPEISADTNRLQQVFWNLLSNSIKFSRAKGYVKISTSYNDKWIEVRVEDNGIGIEPTFLPLVFERFRQADSSSTRRYGGLGIGLSLVKSLVEVHGGEVQAESAGKDQGSTFVVRLPISPQSIIIENRDKQFDGVKISSNQPRILIIEDLEDSLRVLTSIIERQGHEILTARSTEAGLRMAERFLPKVVLMDVNMPGRNPYDVMLELRKSSELANIQVIAISGFLAENERQKILSTGFAGLITKPFRRSELITLINNTLTPNKID
ncbi:MAG: GAF domain-containing protein [Blastocatellia bacterium]|nr:GAF domain-containing protein [Blastocatellia bacterium]